MGLKPTVAPPGKGHNDQWETNCVVCRYGIFAGKPRVRIRERYLTGPAHPECAPTTEETTCPA